MIDGYSIDRQAVYDDAALSVALGLSVECLARARRSGELRHARKGQRILYLGQWVIEWLERDAGEVARG